MARRLLLVALSMSFLTGCMAQPLPTAQRPASRQHLARQAPVKPVGRVTPAEAALPAPTITVRQEAVAAPPAVVKLSEAASVQVTALDADLEAIDLLAEAGGAYSVQTFWGRIKDRYQQAKDGIKRAWTRFKLKREAKALLKDKTTKRQKQYAEELEAIRAHRTEPVTQITPIEGGGHEIVTAWSSDHKGVRHVETRRTVDEEGVTQLLIISVKGEDAKGRTFEVLRTRKLLGADGAYEVTTRDLRTLKDGRTQATYLVKTVAADGAETLEGDILHPDGHKTVITGSRDAEGKIKIEIEKIEPAPVEPEPEAPGTDAAQPDETATEEASASEAA